MNNDIALTVTKMDAARRQLDVAIELWFIGGDPVAVHTLAAAAHEIIHTLFKKKGLKGLFFDNEIIKDKKYRNEINRALKDVASFFKHADKDSSATLPFKTKLNEVLLIYAVDGLRRMGEEWSKVESTFALWLWVHNPDWFTGKVPPGKGIPIEGREKLLGINKREFFEALVLGQFKDEGTWNLP
jgi:hypothetical protein